MKNYEEVQQRKISVTFFIVRGIHAILPYQMGDPMFAEVDHLLLGNRNYQEWSTIEIEIS